MITPAYLVSSFATSGLERLRDTVSLHLVATAQRIPASSSDSAAALETLAEIYSNVHTQLSYASAALARFGFDFGKLLFTSTTSNSDEPTSLSTIESAWLDALSLSLDSAFSQLHDQLDHHTSPATTTPPSQWLLSTQLPASALKDLCSIPADVEGDDAAYDDYSRPNIELVDYPPLAKLLNRILAWINALQLFAPSL